MELYILILNYNRFDETLHCLSLVNKITLDKKVIVIDNGSTNESVKEIKKKFPRVKIFENKKNLGFAKGMNIGIKYALERQASKILLLNNDITFTEKAFITLIKSEGDIVAPVLKYNRNGKFVYDIGGYLNRWVGRNHHKEVKNFKNIDIRNLDYVSGAVMMIKKEVFTKIGLFDEKYFLYYEDADFCLRAKKEGFSVNIESTSIFFHKLGITAGRYSLSTLYHNLRSNLLFINSNIEWNKRPIAWVYWILLVGKVFFNQFLASFRE